MVGGSSTRVVDTSIEANLALLDDLPENITLLELVYAISTITDDERVVIETVISMLGRGRVRLCGTFRGDPVKEFEV